MRYGAIPSNPIVKNENTHNTPQTKMERVRAILTPENSAIGIRIEYKMNTSVFVCHSDARSFIVITVIYFLHCNRKNMTISSTYLYTRWITIFHSFYLFFFLLLRVSHRLKIAVVHLFHFILIRGLQLQVRNCRNYGSVTGLESFERKFGWVEMKTKPNCLVYRNWK